MHGEVRKLPHVIPFTEALGPSARMFVALGRFTPTNVTRVIAVEGELSPRQIQAALRVLHARHPLLRSHIVDGPQPYFVHGDAPVPALHVVARKDDQHWRLVLESVLNTRIGHAPGPLLEVHYVYSDSARAGELIVAAEHAICDGISMNSLCTELIELCARMHARPPRPKLPVLEQLLPPFPLSKRLLSFSSALNKFARVSLRRSLRGARPSAQHSCYTFCELTQEQTQELMARTRAQDTTVTGALMSSVLSVLKQRYPDESHFAISVPINLRPRILGRTLEPADLGNYTSVAYLESGLHGSFWQRARDLKTQLDETVSSDRLLSAVSLIYRAGRFFLRAGKPPFAHAMISNSGLVPLQRDYGKFRTTAFRSATSAPMLSADLSFFCNTLHGRLSINLLFSEEIVSRSEAERVLDQVKASLTTLAPTESQERSR